MINLVTSGLLALIGLALSVGGAWLIAIGGSFYYALAGLAFLFASFLAFSRKPVLLPFYGAFTVASLVWAVWEAGFDWWQLAPRGGLIIVVVM